MPKLTQAHEAAINTAIEVTEGRWRAAGSPESDPRAQMGDLLRELLDMARAYTAMQDASPIKMGSVGTVDPDQYELVTPQEMADKKGRTVQVNVGGSMTVTPKVNVTAALEAEGASEIDAQEAEKLNEE